VLITFLEKDSKAQKIRKKRKSDSANPNAKKSAPEKEQEPDLEPEGPTIREQLEEKRVLMKQLMNEQRQLATRIELERIEYNTLKKELADAPQCEEADEFSHTCVQRLSPRTLESKESHRRREAEDLASA
jgi:predicted  nucleic acid-binding Zn-ribbon protein